MLVVLHQEHSNPGHIGQWFQRNGHPLDIRRHSLGDPLPETLEHHCGLVIFGGPQSANDNLDFIKREIDFVGVALKEEKPYFGVCLGGQMLAKHLGARVWLDEGAHVEVGYHPIRPTECGLQLGPWPDHFYQWHREGFDVPKGGVLVAESDGPFPQQAFVYGAAAVGIQFHPEITYAQVHRWTTRSAQRLTFRGARPREEHITGHLLHAPRVHAWLDRFLHRWVQGDVLASEARKHTEAAA